MEALNDTIFKYWLTGTNMLLLATSHWTYCQQSCSQICH